MNYNNIGSISHLFYARQQLLYRLTMIVVGSVLTLTLLFNLLNSNDENVIAQPTSVFRELGNVLYDTIALELSTETAAPSVPYTVTNQSDETNTQLSSTSANTDVNINTVNPTTQIVARSVQNAPEIAQPSAQAVTRTNIQPQLITVRKHDSITGIASRLKLHRKEISEILKLPQAYPVLNHLQKGHQLTITQDSTGSITNLSYKVKDDEILLVQRIGKAFSSEIRSGNGDLVGKILVASTTIHNSLENSARKAGIQSHLIAQLGAVFGSQADYITHLRSGAKLSLVYQTYYRNGHPVKTGDVLAAEVKDQGKVYSAIRYVSPNGKVGYYTANGQSVESGFLRAPVHYTRISSTFALERFHPILHFSRPHKGVDLAAPGGTPVVATSTGRIIALGRDGGYGNRVEIKFNNTYSTIYGHLARFARNVHYGQFVKQGEVIGYVGMTGLATGPHLHYELHVNGVPHNPLTAALPGGAAIARAQKSVFLNYARSLISRLEQHTAG